MKKELKKWIIDYHEDTDTLFVSRHPIPRDARLLRINDGYDCYVTKRGKIVGIMIEYFTMESKTKIKEFKDFLHKK